MFILHDHVHWYLPLFLLAHPLGTVLGKHESLSPFRSEKTLPHFERLIDNFAWQQIRGWHVLRQIMQVSLPNPNPSAMLTRVAPWNRHWIARSEPWPCNSQRHFDPIASFEVMCLDRNVTVRDPHHEGITWRRTPLLDF